MMDGVKFKIGDVVTVSRLCKPRAIEAVKEQYYIRDEGWFDACALTPYVRPIQVGDRVRWRNDQPFDPPLTILAINGAVAWCKRAVSHDGYSTLKLSDLQRIPEEAA